MQMGTNRPQGRGMKRSTLGDSRSKVKVTCYIWSPGGGIILDPLGPVR